MGGWVGEYTRGGGEGWVNIRMCVLGGGGRRGIGEYTYVCVGGWGGEG